MITSVRRLYPQTWEQLAAACKQAANWHCEHCGAAQFSVATSKKGNPYFVYLHAAHRNHDKGDPNPELICLCVTCHSRYDYAHKQRLKRIHLERMKHLRLLIEQGSVTVTFALPLS